MMPQFDVISISMSSFFEIWECVFLSRDASTPVLWSSGLLVLGIKVKCHECSASSVFFFGTIAKCHSCQTNVNFFGHAGKIVTRVTATSFKIVPNCVHFDIIGYVIKKRKIRVFGYGFFSFLFICGEHPEIRKTK